MPLSPSEVTARAALGNSTWEMRFQVGNEQEELPSQHALPGYETETIRAFQTVPAAETSLFFFFT